MNKHEFIKTLLKRIFNVEETLVFAYSNDTQKIHERINDILIRSYNDSMIYLTYFYTLKLITNEWTIEDLIKELLQENLENMEIMKHIKKVDKPELVANTVIELMKHYKGWI